MGGARRGRKGGGGGTGRGGDGVFFAALEEEGEAGEAGGGEGEHGESGDVVPLAGDVDAAVGEQGEDEGTDEVHAQGERPGEADEERAGPCPAHERGGEKQSGEHARDEAAHAGAGLLDADAAVGEFDDVAVAEGGDAEEMEGAQDVFADPELEGEREAGIGAGRNRRAERPEQEGDGGVPIERDEPDGGAGETDDAGAEQECERRGQHEIDDGVGPTEGGGVEPGGGEGEEREQEGGDEGGAGGGARAEETRRTDGAAFVQEQQKDGGHEEAVGQIRIVAPLGPEVPAQGGDGGGEGARDEFGEERGVAHRNRPGLGGGDHDFLAAAGLAPERVGPG